MRRLRSFTTEQGGNVAALFALALPLVVGGGALGVETTFWYAKRTEMQAAADAAAVAAAIEDRSGSYDAEVAEIARLTAQDNGFDPGSGSIEVLPRAVAGGGQVEVILRDEASRYFSALFNRETVKFSTRAVATFSSAAGACILALDPNVGSAARFSGSSHLTLDGCSVMANSVASDAVNVQGAAWLTADCVISAGGVSATSGLNLSTCPAPIVRAPPVADPFKDLPAPTPSGGCRAVPANGSLSPGRYCNGMTLKGEVILQPGVYHVAGDLTVNATASVTGSGVTIYMTDGGHVKMNGSAHVELAAPTSGVYSGVLFFGNRAYAGGTNKFLGDAGSRMTGAIYFPTQEVDYQGNFSGVNGCLQVVARTIQWTGNTTIAIDCTAHGMKEIPMPNLVRLTA